MFSKKLLDWDAVQAFRDHALNPEHPVTRGTAQNGDIYFQAREACNKFIDAVPAIVEDYMAKISEETGREYHLFNYYGPEDAEDVIVAMGSVTDTIEETIDYLAAKGEKLGVIKVHLFLLFRSRISTQGNACFRETPLCVRPDQGTWRIG